MIILDARHVLYIEPQGSASAEPVEDEVTHAMREAMESAYSDISYLGCHQCVCGAWSDSEDWILANGQRTNSLAVHYLQFHRDEVPEQEIEKVANLSNFYLPPEERASEYGSDICGIYVDKYLENYLPIEIEELGDVEKTARHILLQAIRNGVTDIQCQTEGAMKWRVGRRRLPEAYFTPPAMQQMMAALRRLAGLPDFRPDMPCEENLAHKRLVFREQTSDIEIRCRVV
jgi:hypothetical protein